MRNKLGMICMSMGAVLILAALSLCLINWQEDKAAGTRVDVITCQLIDKIEDFRTDDSLVDPLDPTMSEIEIDGNMYIGTLYIKSLHLSLPVMSSWSYSKLKIAPCRYAGSTKTNDLVIAAHNYTRHFRRLKTLSEGDTVFFTDADGISTEYVVSAVEILRSTDVKDMTAGEYDLTLFTCTYGGRDRVTVRCDRVEQ